MDAEDLAFEAMLAVVHVMMRDFGMTPDAALTIIRDEISVVDIALGDERQGRVTPEQMSEARAHLKALRARAQS